MTGSEATALSHLIENTRSPGIPCTHSAEMSCVANPCRRARRCSVYTTWRCWMDGLFRRWLAGVYARLSHCLGVSASHYPTRGKHICRSSNNVETQLVETVGDYPAGANLGRLMGVLNLRTPSIGLV